MPQPQTLNDKLVAACNDYLYNHLYPARLGYGFDHGSDQHRDLVRTFFAGAMELLIAIDDKELVKELMPFYAAMAAVDWRPGEEFRAPTN